MQVHVRFFATLKDRAKTESTQVDLPDPATVRSLLERLSTLYPDLQPALTSALVAVNEEYAFPDDALHDRDEVALFPPVSGGAGWPRHFAVTEDVLDIDAIVAHVTRDETGAVVVFTGAVRGVTASGEGDQITDHLFYEAYKGMAEKKLAQVGDEIAEKFPNVQGIAIVQRIGQLQVGEVTVLVACASGHRADGVFDAARYGIDRLKEIVPIWKKEVGPSGDVWIEGSYHPTPADVSQAGAGLPERLRADGDFTVGCPACGETYSLDDHPLRCECGEPLVMVQTPPFRRSAIFTSEQSMWRYRDMLLPPGIEPVTMGEGWTPLIEVEAEQSSLYVKLESLNPTGSFKDRTASVLTSVLAHQGVNGVHDDSSGNAGAALAGYAARAGLRATIYVPASASPAKLAQVQLYGATLETISGPRSAANDAAELAAEQGASHYASHILHPMSTIGYKSVAFEIWEQLEYKAPDKVIVPLGQGTHLLGLFAGFNDLLEANAITKLPQLIGVQARACAPLWRTMHDPDSELREGETLAEGIRIVSPDRHDAVLNAIRESKGTIIAVDEAEIIEGLQELGARGIIAEPTSAVIWPAYQQIAGSNTVNETVVIIVTGSGLKTPALGTLLNNNTPSETQTEKDSR